MIPQASGPVLNSGELTSVHGIQVAFDNVMLCGSHYLSSGIDDTPETTRNKIKEKNQVKKKVMSLSRGCMYMFDYLNGPRITSKGGQQKLGGKSIPVYQRRS